MPFRGRNGRFRGLAPHFRPKNGPFPRKTGHFGLKTGHHHAKVIHHHVKVMDHFAVVMRHFLRVMDHLRVVRRHSGVVTHPFVRVMNPFVVVMDHRVTVRRHLAVEMRPIVEEMAGCGAGDAPGGSPGSPCAGSLRDRLIGQAVGLESGHAHGRDAAGFAPGGQDLFWVMPFLVCRKKGGACRGMSRFLGLQSFSGVTSYDDVCIHCFTCS